jgi:hypothetical protein
MHDHLTGFVAHRSAEVPTPSKEDGQWSQSQIEEAQMSDQMIQMKSKRGVLEIVT